MSGAKRISRIWTWTPGVALCAALVTACGGSSTPPPAPDGGGDGGVLDLGMPMDDAGTSTTAAMDGGFRDTGVEDLCDPLAQTGCDAPDTKCIIETGASQCIAPSPEDQGYGEECQGGRCEPGMVCVGTGTGTTAVCRQVCDRGSGAGCDSLAVAADCLESVRGTNYGVCTELPPECDPVTQDPCGAGEACQTLLRFDGSFDLRCRPAGPGQAGDECSNQRCDRGFICVNFGGAPTCQTICGDGNDCTTGTCSGSVNGVDVKFCAE